MKAKLLYWWRKYVWASDYWRYEFPWSTPEEPDWSGLTYYSVAVSFAEDPKTGTGRIKYCPEGPPDIILNKITITGVPE